ncbi:MAG: hypothetical protein WED10_03965 [Brumimicrobium sp.]
MKSTVKDMTPLQGFPVAISQHLLDNSNLNRITTSRGNKYGRSA